MAQHDMNIANQGFPAFRADLNDALGALVSNSSGATAPSTTFAHQFWVDTAADPSVLKIRNADNDAWITIGSINQTDDKFKLTPADGVSTDTISELTSAAGVTIDGVLLKDTTVIANTIKASGTSSTQGEVQLFEDTDNGTNYVAIKAPASIASDVTWTLPNADGTANQVLKTDGSGALGWATPSAGKVLQVVSVTKTDTYSESVARGAIASNDAISASITPTSASSKILIISSLNVSSSSANRVATVLYKGGSVISAYTGDASGNRGRVSSADSIDQTYVQTSISSNYLDSPNTTSSTTYSFRLRHGSGETQTVYLNAPSSDDNENYQMRSASTITLMEIAG